MINAAKVYLLGTTNAGTSEVKTEPEEEQKPVETEEDVSEVSGREACYEFFNAPEGAFEAIKSSIAYVPQAAGKVVEKALCPETIAGKAKKFGYCMELSSGTKINNWYYGSAIGTPAGTEGECIDVSKLPPLPTDGLPNGIPGLPNTPDLPYIP